MAQFNSKPYASSCEIKQIALYKANEEKAYANLTDMALFIQYHESILWPAYGATLVLIDNGENLISTMPITGFEKVVFELVDAKEDTYFYEFRIFKVANRITKDRTQVYTLALISTEGLLNEGIRVNKVISGTTSSVVGKLLSEYLDVTSLRIASEESVTSIKCIPAKKTPFAVIRSLQAKTIAQKEAPPKLASFREDSGENSALQRSVQSDSPGDASQANGTAGYLFFQVTRKNVKSQFIFKSIDSLSSQKPKNGIYTYSPGKTFEESMNKIQEVQFGKEIDTMQKMREGAYSSLVCYYDINTGKYEEQVYSLTNTWNDMVHLGTNTELPAGQKTLSQYPTRVMSTIVNHENWYMGTGVGSNEDDKSSDNSFPDYVKQYLPQSISRLGIMFNYELTISLTANLDLNAGDTIDIRIPNQVPDADRKDEVWDPTYSGTYLIKTVNHQIDVKGQNAYTVLELIRDSCGIKSYDNNNSQTE